MIPRFSLLFARNVLGVVLAVVFLSNIERTVCDMFLVRWQRVVVRIQR